ncbi:MAG: hypothetical protein K2Q10_07040 [Rhodospirillales bacterium]|nr:hypothetical protein [Rhodospirillales bacterium]
MCVCEEAGWDSADGGWVVWWFRLKLEPMPICRSLSLAVPAALSLAALIVFWPDQPVPPAPALSDLPEVFAPDCLTTSERDWGIQVLALTQSPDKARLEMRLRVVEPNRARLLWSALPQARLLHDASGTILNRTAGQVPLPSPELGRTYRIEFDNPGVAVRPKQLVTVRLAGFHMEGVRVFR